MIILTLKNKRLQGKTQEQVKEQLHALAEQAMVDEIMILNMISDKEGRHQSFRLLADVFELA